MSDNIQKIFTSNLNRLLNLHGRTQLELSKYMGVSNTTVNNWSKGYNTPRMDKIDKICAFFSIQREDLLTEQEATSSTVDSSTTKGVRIPVVGRVAAGIPICAEEEIIDFEDIPIELAKRGEFFGLRIRGDSMSPTIPDKSNVIVRKQDDAETGDIVIALVNGHEGVCKRLKKMDYGIMLISINPAYDPLVFTHKELDNLPVQIVGKVVEVRIKL